MKGEGLDPKQVCRLSIPAQELLVFPPPHLQELGPGAVLEGLASGGADKEYRHRMLAGRGNRLGLSPSEVLKLNAKFRFPKGWD